VTTQFRVYAINSIGSSNPSSPAAITVPLLKPGTPTNLVVGPASTGSTLVRLTWDAPANLGGALQASYQISRSLDNGATWVAITTVSATNVVLGGTARGVTAQYRVATRTGFGLGDQSAPVSYMTPVVAPSAPVVAVPVLDTASSRVTISWRAPSDNGGAQITGYRVDKFENSQWTTLVTTDGATLSTSTAMSAPGLAVGYRVYAINSAGMSTSYGYTTIRMPFAPPSAPGTPAATVTSVTGSTAKRVALTWAPTTNFGGSTLAFYQVEVSADGTNWSTVGTTAGTAWQGTAPAAGTSLQFRITVRTSAGLTASSAAVNVAG
jgi:titin